jgi:microcystin-dependent protein
MQPFIGQITLFPYNFAPLGWAECVGQTLPITQYTALFSLIGTYYGGNGTTNFNLPDLRGRIAVGQGTLPGGSTFDLAETGGIETVALQGNNLPSHTHALQAVSSQGTQNVPAGGILAKVAKVTLQIRDHGNIYNTGAANTALTDASIVPLGSNQPQPHNNMQPSLGLRYCIALTGIFPPRP